MNKLTIRTAAAIAFILTGIGIVNLWSSEADLKADTAAVPGSVEDPVVTKSFVEKQVAVLVQRELSKQGQGDIQAMLDEFRKEMSDKGTSQGVEVVSIAAGKTLIAKDGAEVVVRAGKAIAYSSDSNGIADVTAGVDIKNGFPVANNHLMLFPRGGRGITTEPSFTGSLTVMVRGGHEIK